MCSAVAPLVCIAISAVFLLSLAAAAGFVAFLPDGFLAGLAALALRVVIVFLVDIVWLLRESGPGRIARANATDRSERIEHRVVCEQCHGSFGPETAMEWPADKVERRL